MPASYPTSVKTFVSRNAGDVIQPAHVNDLQDEVNAIETGLKAGLAHSLLFTPDATFDIGASGATRPRDIYFSRNAFGQTLNLSGGALRQLVISGTAADAGMQVTSVGGSGKAYSLYTNTAGSLILQDDADGTPSIGITGDVVTLTATSGVTIVTNLSTGAISTSGLISPAQIVANTDNYNPTGLATATLLRLTTDVSRNLTGIVAQTAGRQFVLANLGAANLVLIHDATSTAANRFYCPGNANFTMTPTSYVHLLYDNTLTRWLVMPCNS
jgi:hypothetical protein